MWTTPYKTGSAELGGQGGHFFEVRQQSDKQDLEFLLKPDICPESLGICRKCEKAENPQSWFELAPHLHEWKMHSALDHLAILLDTINEMTLWDFNGYQYSSSKYHTTNYTGYIA